MSVAFGKHTISAAVATNVEDPLLSPMIEDRECYRRVIEYLHRRVPGKRECWLETDRSSARCGVVLWRQNSLRAPTANDTQRVCHTYHWYSDSRMSLSPLVEDSLGPGFVKVENWTNRVVANENEIPSMWSRRVVRSDSDDGWLRTGSMNLDSSRSDRRSDDIEWNTTAKERIHHALHNGLLDAALCYSDDRLNEWDRPMICGKNAVVVERS